jgi:GT2 family glycosyltransferase
MKYSVVIPTYNNCEKYLKPCIDSIIKYTKMTDIQLVISANGCTDNTQAYLAYLQTAIPNLKIVWSDEPLGYSKATNEGIKVATADKIILLNNDTVLLDQPTNQWLDILNNPFRVNPKCGISCIIKTHSEPAGRDFAIFFCVMVGKKVFDAIGLLNEEYGVGAGEDTEFCIETENAGFEVCEVFEKYWGENLFTGGFPIYHRGEGTVHDPNLVQNWQDTFYRNSLKLAKKYNPNWYRQKLTNNFERAVFFKGDKVYSRETTRYQWAAKNILGNKVLEIGCSTGYGIQFFSDDIEYLGLDYDPIIVEVAKEQKWDNAQFVNADINLYPIEYKDTIIAFEVIEHLENGLEIVEKLKKHCKRLLITVPWNEPKGFWGEHHKLHGLNESHFFGFEFQYINEHGQINDQPDPINSTNKCNLMLCKYSAQ